MNGILQLTTNTCVQQRSELTYKFNNGLGRHGWLRLTPAYSVKLVQSILEEHSGQSLNILDPFSGTGTTPLCAISAGHDAFAIEINPFLVWLGQAKMANYSPEDIDTTHTVAKQLVNRLRTGKMTPCQPPAIHNIERWWNKDILNQLCVLKSGIESVSDAFRSIKVLMLIAFSRTMLSVSNAAFNHQSMSFKHQEYTQEKLFEQSGDIFTEYLADIEMVLDGASINPKKAGKIILGDSRQVNRYIASKIDLVITSPPYPNRMSYIRELRPYMYWLGFIKEAREAGELDWEAIGGTWGIATSRLRDWTKQENVYFPEELMNVIEQIASSNQKSAHLLAQYVAKYFADTWLHLESLTKVLKKGAEVHYIVGNVTFYGHVVPVEKIYAHMMDRIGFRSTNIITIRKRNSNKQLYEFDIHGSYD